MGKDLGRSSERGLKLPVVNGAVQAAGALVFVALRRRKGLLVALNNVEIEYNLNDTKGQKKIILKHILPPTNYSSHCDTGMRCNR